MFKEFSKLPYFTTSQVGLFTSNKNVAKVNISRWIKNKSIIRIREWYYVKSEFINVINLSWKLKEYTEFIGSNLVYTPSYLSMEYVLFENNILTENVYSFTLVTTKKTVKFKNDFWVFNYKSIKKEYFSDYEIIKIWDYTIYKATLEKALFDYFYFKRW
jgi:predicted transcriptional regulator of viral defense system